MGRDSKAADERDRLLVVGSFDLPANPYLTPSAKLEDRSGYPFAMASRDLPYAGPGRPVPAPVAVDG